MADVASLSDGSTCLYRMFDRDGRLLYVGISVNVLRRIWEHGNGKVWWGDVAEMTIKHYRNRDLALAVEEMAIRTEGPLYNIKLVDPDDATRDPGETVSPGVRRGEALVRPLTIEESAAIRTNSLFFGEDWVKVDSEGVDISTYSPELRRERFPHGTIGSPGVMFVKGLLTPLYVRIIEPMPSDFDAETA